MWNIKTGEEIRAAESTGLPYRICSTWNNRWTPSMSHQLDTRGSESIFGFHAETFHQLVELIK